jgi:uncharacterized protein YybS (DUF2232 family)
VIGVAVASALVYASGIVMPLLVPLATLAPLPLALQRIQKGAFAAAQAAALASLLLALAFSGESAFRYAVCLALPGLLIGGQMARGRGLIRGCLLAFLWLSAVIGAELLASGPKVATAMLQPFEQMRSAEFIEGIRQSGLAAERVEEIAEQFRTMHAVMKVVYPSMLFIMGALVVLLNAALLKAWLLRRDPGWLDGGEFETLRWPLAMAVAFVASALMLTAKELQPIGYNALLLVAFFFALQGLAVVAYYVHRLAGPPLLRAAVVLLVLMNPWAPQILALLGLFDTWFDFRKWADPPQPADGQR